MIGVHYGIHCTNFAVEEFLAFVFVSWIEDLLKVVYRYFKASSKTQLEFKTLVEMTEKRRAKIIKHITLQWDSLLDPYKRILVEYYTLVVKMALDLKANEPSKNFYCDLCNLKCFFGLALIVSHKGCPLSLLSICLIRCCQILDSITKWISI